MYDDYPRPPPTDRFVQRWLFITACLAALMLLWHFLPTLESAMAPRQADERTVTPRGELAADERSTIALFEQSRDSVVFISTAQLVRDAWSRNVFSVPRGTGSGFVWDDAGHVVTNYHVIEGASQATVKLSDGRDYQAALVGASPAHDIAVLRIGVGFKRPPAVPIGTSADLKVGQKVFAIGNPFGLDWTLTTGIISALDRSLASENRQGQGHGAIEHLIQTDAAINPGNSGGPLLDSAGRLIGINTAIYSPSGASAGIGFAVPVDTVMRVVPQILQKGQYLPPALGVQLDEATNARLLRALDLEGAVVLRVLPGSAAERAGLLGLGRSADGSLVAGDVITAVDGKPVKSVAQLQARLDEYRVGDVALLKVQRAGQQREVAVELQAGER
ncbi:MAG: PDZ domain-containing protein [Rhodoferax sp.]|nr:MAG: PDZ domain-containing protein [Rhodoferax sp.]